MTFGPSVTVLNFTHPLNADEPMLVKELEKELGTDHLRQPEKADEPMDVTPDGMEAVVNSGQPAKADEPIVLNDVGMETVVSEEHP